MPVSRLFSDGFGRVARRSRARAVPVAAVLALLALGACDEATAPSGKPAAVDVRVYLDRDGSGTFTAADSGLSGIALSLTPTEGTGAPLEATSNAQGVASFSEVAPGAYTLAVPATAPTGTVLATAAAPRVVVSAIGQVQAPEVRYSWVPGRITGRIFRDDDASGGFTEGDTPGAGLYVVLTRGGTRVDSVTADAEGVYGFPFLTPGTYGVRLENPGTIAYPDGAERTVAVVAGATNTVDGIFTGALVIPIAEARARAVGSTVAVIGNLTVRPGRFTSGVNSELWVQDATGGIAAFSVPTADSAQYQLGDRLEITGTRSVFSAQSQITITRIANLGAGTVPTAAVQTAAQARALTRDGQLVRVAGLDILSVPTGTGAAFTVIAAEGTDTLQIRVAGLGTDLTRESFVVGNRYDVTGVLTQFNGTAQLKIRTAGDLVAATTGPTIATVRRDGVIGTQYTVKGRVSVAPGDMPTSGTNTTNSELWVQDETGGIAVFSVPTADSTTLARGDTVTVTGTLAAFSGQLQLATPTVVRGGAGTPVAPVVQTMDEIAARTLEGRLVTLSGFTVATVQAGTAAAFNVDGTADGQTMRIRVSGALRGLTRDSFTVGSTYTVTGILTQNGGVTQIKLRGSDDLVAGATISSIESVRTDGTNTTVYTVAGRITAAPGQIPTSGTNTTNSELWVQDATGGIAVFSVPTADSTRLQLGNTVTVTGARAAFSGQLQLGSPTVVRTGAGTPVTPVSQTAAEIVARALEGQLVTFTGFTVTAVGTGTSAAFNVDGTVDGQAVQVRVAGALRGLTRDSFTVGSTYTVTGILSQFNGTAQVKVRLASDITP